MPIVNNQTIKVIINNDLYFMLSLIALRVTVEYYMCNPLVNKNFYLEVLTG